MTWLRRLGGALRLLLAGWLLWRLVGPETRRRYPMPQEPPQRFPGGTVLVGHRELFVRQAGPEDGPPLVLIQGWSFDGLMTFYQIIPALAERFRVIVPDLRNHGRSDWVRGRFEVADLADEVAGTLRALDVRNATVVGYSLGGMVAQELARRHGDLVGHMVLGATAARPVPVRRSLTAVAFWLGRVISRVSTTEMAWLTTYVLRRSGTLLPEHERWMYEALKRRDPTLFYESAYAIRRFDSRSWVSSLKVPATVVIPSRDVLIRPAAQHQLAELLADAEVVELWGAGHESIFSRSDDYVKLITRVVESRHQS